MKCPSKEIDKNNISLLLPKPRFLHSLFESQHSLCLLLLVFLWCFCSPRRSDVFALEQAGSAEELSGLSSDIRACLLLCGQAEKSWRQSRSQTLDPGVCKHTLTHIANPRLCSNLLQAAMHCSTARPGAVRTERASTGFTVLQAPPPSAGSCIPGSVSIPAGLVVDSH